MNEHTTEVVAGTAGWSIPRQHADAFEPGSSALARYATRLRGTEINSTFYRSHRPETYLRWAETVPAGFRFAVKAPKTITHERRLVDAGATFAAFVAEIAPLGSKTGPILLQLPPKLEFDGEVAALFFREARAEWSGALVLEPRHASWFTGEANRLLLDLSIARVGADPVRGPDGQLPGGHPSTCYLRLHGSPKVYFSPYGDETLDWVQQVLTASSAPDRWCIFDNTASGAAACDALRLDRRLTTADGR